MGRVARRWPEATREAALDLDWPPLSKAIEAATPRIEREAAVVDTEKVPEPAVRVSERAPSTHALGEDEGEASASKSGKGASTDQPSIATVEKTAADLFSPSPSPPRMF